jgi:hypothetical protein
MVNENRDVTYNVPVYYSGGEKHQAKLSGRDSCPMVDGSGDQDLIFLGNWSTAFFVPINNATTS